MNLEAIQANSGRLWHYDSNWSATRNASVATVVNSDTNLLNWNDVISAIYHSSFYQVFRVMLTFPTNTISGTLTAATLYLASNPQSLGVARGVNVYVSTHHNPVVIGDFDINRLGALSGSQAAWVSADETWNALALNIAHINVGAVTKLALLDTFHDVNNIEPSSRHDSCQGIYPPGHDTLAPYLKLTFESEPEEPKRGNNYCLGLRIKDKVFNWVSKTQSKFGDF